MPIIVSSRWCLISEFQSALSCLLEMDNGFTTQQWKHGRRRSLITRNNIVLWEKMWFGMISNQITKFQIKSKSNHTFSKSNHYVWFNHDLNQIMIWICPSLRSRLHDFHPIAARWTKAVDRPYRPIVITELLHFCAAHALPWSIRFFQNHSLFIPRSHV